MLERLVENWLTKVNERSFEIPFCQLLASEGYQIIHLSRHGPAEQGKDILAMDANGVPCAFQLKGSFGGKLTQTEWGKIFPQIQRLVELPIKHPSIDENAARKTFLVTTGELDEEVRLEIIDRNKDWEKRAYPKLETVVKGQLLSRFAKLHTDFWPISLANEKELLEFFLIDGRSNIKKRRLFDFIHNLLLSFDKTKGLQSLQRAFSSAAILNSYALSSFDAKENHVALIEGWTIFLATLLSYITREGIEAKYWQETYNLTINAIENAAEKLVDELKNREYLTEGDPFVDPQFYRCRVTLLCSLVAWLSIWNFATKDDVDNDPWFHNFIRTHEKDLQLWGEAAIPQYFSIYWFLKDTEDALLPDRILFDLAHTICQSNQFGKGLADPYHDFAEIVSRVIEIGTGLGDSEENFKGRSYSLESLVQILAKRGWRGVLTELWKPITGIQFASFIPKEAWQFSLWYTDEGATNTKMANALQSWAALVKEAEVFDASYILNNFKDDPELLLLFAIVYPHRFTPDVVKFLDSEL